MVAMSWSNAAAGGHKIDPLGSLFKLDNNLPIFRNDLRFKTFLRRKFLACPSF
jgi:hypothetical protein